MLCQEIQLDFQHEKEERRAAAEKQRVESDKQVELSKLYRHYLLEVLEVVMEVVVEVVVEGVVVLIKIQSYSFVVFRQ